MYQGRLESVLSTLGERQARALGSRLAGHRLVAAYSSPLNRAKRTLELILDAQDTHPPATILREARELIEIDHGEWSGLTKQQVADRWSDLAEQWRTAPASVRMPGGESLLEVRQRALTWLANVRQEYTEGEILVVTHGTVLRLLLAHFLEMTPDQIWSIEAENCALSVVEDYDVPLVMAINDCCHLEGVRSSLSAQVR